MSKMKEIYQIVKEVENLVNTKSTITNLKSILDNLNITHLTIDEWGVIISYLERYYIISDISYPYEIIIEQDEVTS
jgi:hypothetical protein